jgi:hypothetical protein
MGPFKRPTATTIAALKDDGDRLNSWAAEDLGVQPGAEVEITYFLPETTHGKARGAGVPLEGDLWPWRVWRRIPI